MTVLITSSSSITMSDVAYLKTALGVHPNFPKEVATLPCDD